MTELQQLLDDMNEYLDADLYEMEKIQFVVNRDKGPGARELALVKTKLEEAQLWLGAAAKKAAQKED